MAKLSTTSVFGDLLVDGMIHGNVTGNLTGNASTATSATTATSAGKWTTARTITIGSKGKTVDGSANVSWTLAEIGAAAASHGTHLTLGTGSSNAYRGDYGNTAYNHSQAAHAPSNAQKNSDITKAEIEAKLTGNITSHTHSTYATTSTTGSLSSLQTSAKGSLVAAINEVFQSGNNAKQQLVDALSAQGVSASTSDSWDVLISKISGVSTGLHAVAVSSLPATGAANTIYVVTDNPNQNIIISNDLSDYDYNSSSIFIRLETSASNATKIQTTKDNTEINYHIVQAIQSYKGLESYIYENAAWKEITIGDPIYLYNGVFSDKDFLGDVAGTSYWKTVDGTGVVLTCSTSTSTSLTYNSYGVTFENQINFSLFKKVIVSIYGTYSFDHFYVFKSTTAKEWHEDGNLVENNSSVIVNSISPGTITENVQEFTIDISTWTGLGYFGVAMHEGVGSWTRGESVYITNLKFTS